MPMRRIRVDERAGYIAETKGTRTYPWRVFMLAKNEIGLCENDAVYALATPSKVEDVSWIRPGLSVWEWWNDWNISGVDFEAGINTATYMHYIDFAARHGVPYLVVDAGWTDRFQLDRYNPDVDIEQLVKYAAKKSVGLILWTTWPQLDGRQEEVFAKFAKLGVKGFKIDYMDRDDQLIARFLEETARVAAKHKLVLDFHGMHKPTGLSRTYPNILNYEGVHGLECTKWEDDTDFMRNDLLCFFTRMSAGPMDYTPGAMLNYTREQFRSSMTKPGSQGTRAHQMALVSMYEAPLQMLCDSPTQYEKNRECFAFMARTPTFWEETKGIAGSMEDYAVIARRLGRSWYLSAINSWEARELEVDLGFLGGGKWQAEIFADGRNAHRDATDYVHEYRLLEKDGKIKIRMAPGGGWTARIEPVPVNEEGLRRLKLMSFNIRMGCGHDHPFRLKRGDEGWLPKCAEVIREFAPDFVGLQEVDRNSWRAGFLDQTQVVAGYAGMHGEWVEKIPLYGVSTLSKRRPVSVNKVLMRGSSHTRALMISDYGDIVIANTHWPLSAKTRLAAAATTRESLKDLALKKPVFLMGDLNAQPDSPEIQALKEDFVVLSDETLPTWPAKDPKVTIDYIMVDKAHAEKVKVISKQTLPVPDATDHAALVVEVELP
jgi:endonuclease/exonuclease/phosphatase family metal-dependent hydrolase